MNIFAFQRDHIGYMVENGLEKTRVDIDKHIKEDTATVQINDDDRLEQVHKKG